MLIVVTTFGFANVIDDLAALELAARPLIASDIIDMDEATPNKQWVDTSGDVSPTGIWYYQVTAYNNVCSAEGPFLAGVTLSPAHHSRSFPSWEPESVRVTLHLNDI